MNDQHHVSAASPDSLRPPWSHLALTVLEADIALEAALYQHERFAAGKDHDYCPGSIERRTERLRAVLQCLVCTAQAKLVEIAAGNEPVAPPDKVAGDFTRGSGV